MTKQFKAEIVAVGTELLLGQIVNTNAQWISEQLALYGINIYNHVVVGDNLERVKDTFEIAHHRSDIIIVTGGLGPTEDDLTREAFQKLTNLDIIDHERSLKKITDYFSRRKWQMTPSNRKQARVFETATVLENKIGMAPGMIINYEERVWVFLPGVPREMKQLFSDEALPYLYELTGKEEVLRSHILKFVGIGESALEHELIDLIHQQTNPTIAPLATDDGIIIRLTGKAKTNEALEEMLLATRQMVLDRVGDYLVAENEETLEEVVIRNLKEKNVTIAAAESLTGGLFTEKLVSVSGASSVVAGGVICYTKEVKMNTLDVPSEVIEQDGTVSEACAIHLARNVKEKLGSNIGISFTGVAGPDAIEGKEPGNVYIGIAIDGKQEKAYGFEFLGDRNIIRQRAATKGLEIIFNQLKLINEGNF